MIRKPKIPVYWAPQPGQQTLFATCPADEVFYGGTRGGGKSDGAIGKQIRGATRYEHAWNGLIVRRKFKDLNEIRRRFDELIRGGMPAARVGGEKETNYVRFANGAVITLTAIQHMDQTADWIGHQFTSISIDEAPNIPFISNLIDFLRGSLRSPHGVPTQIVLTGNPGGPGSSSINLMYIQPSPEYLPGQIIRNTYKDDLGQDHTISQVFIKSTIYDNPILMKADPKYVAMLMSIKDPMLKAAWLDGRWDVFIGQAFNFTERHVLSEGIWPIPEYAPIYMTFDYGYGAPFSLGWWWVDNDNRVYRFAEWYGWDGKTPNKGCRITDEEIADGILEREKQMGLGGRKITRLGGRDCFQRKPNYMGGGQGPGTAENFEAYAKSGKARERYGEGISLVLQPGDPSRELKIRQFRNRLRVPVDAKELPMLVIYPNCTHFKRTVPSLCLSEMTGEDLDDGQEDHVYDEACHICMARPIGITDDVVSIIAAKEAATREISALDSASKMAAADFAAHKRQLANRLPDGVTPEMLLNDPALDPGVFGLDEEAFDILREAGIKI